MTPVKKVVPDCPFPQEAINMQLNKMMSDPVFEHSDILKRFLQFVVEESMNGRANQIKEYTVAIKILNKPVCFNPQENGVVRIHAGRLRRALNHYYDSTGFNDPIRIAIPKGNYVPVFSNNTGNDIAFEKEELEKNDATHKHTVIAVAPFSHGGADNLNSAFAEGMGMQLSTALMNLDQFGVVGYYTMRKIAEKYSDINTISNMVGAQYMVTGYIQSNGNAIRIYLQLLRTGSSQVVWSKMFERKLSFRNLFAIQDEIIKEAKAEMEIVLGRKNKKVASHSLVAVA